MTPQDRIDTGFAPWSLMTPDPAKARATRPQVQTAAAVHEDKRAPEMAADDGYMFGDDGLTFGDVLDIVNPLQHLPVVGALYRSITGDEASPGAKMAGGAIYGGPIGLASAMINNAIEETTGDDVMGHMLAMVGLGDDSGEGVDSLLDDESLAASGAAGPTVAGIGTGAGIGAAVPTLPPGTVPIGAEAELAAMAMAAGPSSSGGARQLDQAQAAFLERLAAKASDADSGPNAAGAILAETGAEPLDAILTGQQTAAVNSGAGRKDYRGVARLSPEMAQHLAMLAQAGSPSQALTQQASAQQAQGVRPSGAQSQADMRSASAKYSAALPLSIDGAEPAANPFAALQAKADEPDPFETAMNRLGLNPPTVKTRGGEDTQSKVMEAAFGPGQSQTANLAEAAGITAPSGGGVPSAMMDALNRYQAMKQQG